MSTFWKQAIEAAVWTFAQVFLVMMAAGVADIAIGDWTAVTSLAASAALGAAAAAVSIIKSIVVRNIGAEDSPLISG